MLPADPTKYWCRAFYVAVAVVAVAGALVCLGAGTRLGTLVLAAIAVGAGALAVRAHEGVGATLYRWFVRDSYAFGRVVRGMAQVACFAIVIAGRVGATGLAVARPSHCTTWSEKRSLPRDAYAATYLRPGLEPATGWAGRFVAWARSSGNSWALALLPFLLLQRSAQEPDVSEVRGEIYTLY